MEITLEKILESIIFVSDQPLDLDTLTSIINRGDEAEGEKEEKEGDGEDTVLAESHSKKAIEEALEKLIWKYAADTYPFEVKKVAKGYQFFTKRAFYPYVRKATVIRNQKRLTRATLETLAIIAYRQPATKAEIEFIRGVNCDYAVQKLLEKKLIQIVGRADAVGKPLLYGTSVFFMQYFGINGVEDLPKLQEFEELMEDNMELFKQYQEAKGEENEEGETKQPELALEAEGNEGNEGNKEESELESENGSESENESEDVSNEE